VVITILNSVPSLRRIRRTSGSPLLMCDLVALWHDGAVPAFLPTLKAETFPAATKKAHWYGFDRGVDGSIWLHLSAAGAGARARQDGYRHRT
jgi:hypothetical protein